MHINAKENTWLHVAGKKLELNLNYLLDYDDDDKVRADDISLDEIEEIEAERKTADWASVGEELEMLQQGSSKER